MNIFKRATLAFIFLQVVATTSTIAGSGCGKNPIHSSGGVNVSVKFKPDAGGDRRFHLTLPRNYDKNKPHALIFGYAGTNWVGEKIKPYLGLEGSQVSKKGNEIFVYPDPKWRDFGDWGNLGGWLLGPHAAPANGKEDINFTKALVEYLEENYCVDTKRVFATGHSWGGDMAAVVSCFLDDTFRATAPVAANKPYWFTKEDDSKIKCKGNTSVWTFFGKNDTHILVSLEIYNVITGLKMPVVMEKINSINSILADPVINV